MRFKSSDPCRVGICRVSLWVYHQLFLLLFSYSHSHDIFFFYLSVSSAIQYYQVEVGSEFKNIYVFSNYKAGEAK